MNNLCLCGCGKEVKLKSSRWYQGHHNNSSDVKIKKKQSCLKHFGVDSPLKSKEVREKSKHTCLEKYNVENVYQNKDIQEKYKQTCLEKIWC